MTDLAPQFPIYIPSKSRADVATTPDVLDVLGVPFRLVVEQQQFDDYAARFGPDRVLVLDESFRDSYDTCLPDFDPATQSYGSGPARNFIWEHSISEGHAWHWTIDDNIQLFARLHRNQRIPVGDGLIFRAMEDFVLRYRNIAMAGPDYWMFALSRAASRPFALNTRIFSCNLIRNDVALRWRCRYNEDLDLSIRLLKEGWTTVLFKAFLQYKTTTQVIPGGNTEAFYAAEGTRPKSEMIVRLHPDVCRLARRYGRDHHVADFGPWKNRQLVPVDDPPPVEPDRYKMALVDRARPERPTP